MTAAYLLAALGPDDATPSSDLPHVRRSDIVLVQRVRQGDESALEAIYHAHHAAMWTVAHRYVHDRDLAEDIVHDVFQMIWERRASLIVTQSLSTYMLGSVRHRALNVLRHRGVTQRAAEQMLHDETIPAFGSALPTPEAVTDAADLDARVLHYLRALPPRTQSLVFLRWQHGLTYDEIAAALGMSGAAAKKLGQRVQAALRPLLEELMP